MGKKNDGNDEGSPSGHKRKAAAAAHRISQENAVVREEMRIKRQRDALEQGRLALIWVIL